MSRYIILLLIIVLSLGAGIFYSCSQEKSETETTAPDSAAAEGAFVGDQVCQSCHASEFASWKGSHHDLAMKKATPESVLGNFGDVTFNHRGESYRFFREDSLYKVEAPGPEGEQKIYQITHTFGWTPLQQYLVDFGDGKRQVLNIAWDTQKKRWFALNPDEDIQHGDWLHWTGGAMNWNTMCADCHSTNLEQNFIASADSFHTTWSSINVSCESCHGPGRQHAEFMQSEEVDDATIDRIRRDLRLTEESSQMDQITQCAQCHSLREGITDNYRHRGDFFNHYNPSLPHPTSYFADGQIKEEVYVYGSFLQSKMFQEGVECTDCHDPHTLKLKANVTDNSLCMSCHASKYDSPEHHFHEPNTKSSQCVSCHMPGRYYMEIDFRRDHSFRIPRPDLSQKIDAPNACNSCHEDKSAEWAAGAIEKWYGPDRPSHFSETLVQAHLRGPEASDELQQLIADTLQPDIARATAAWYLGQFPSQEGIDMLQDMLEDESPLVRTSAARAIANASPEIRQSILPDALDDSIRAVRLAAADGLSEMGPADISFSRKQDFRQAREEYEHYLEFNQYFPQGQMNRGQYFEEQGELKKAVAAYKSAIAKDSTFNPARINLAYLYNRLGNQQEARQQLETVIQQEPSYGPAYYSLALLLAEQQQLQQAVSYLEKAAELMPDHERVQYNLAISYQRLGKPNQAEQAYLAALELDPENPDFLYGISTLYVQQEQYRKALPHARKLPDIRPDYPNAQNLLDLISRQIKENP